MKLYNWLTTQYPAEYFSVSTTQTVIEEDEPLAITRNITFEHRGTEVLRISKAFFEAVRGASLSEVCDGAVAMYVPRRFIGYVELKSACTANNVLKARKQIIASRKLMQNAAVICKINIDSYSQQGIIVTQPITDETLTKARQRRQRDDDKKVSFSNARFLLNLVEGKAKDTETGMLLVHVVAGEITNLNQIS